VVPTVGADDRRAPPARGSSAFRNSAAGKRVVALRVEPRCEAVPEPLGALPRAPVDLVPDETLLVELGPEPAMLACMKPKGRYNARLALRRGVDVVTSTDPADVHEFFFVLEQTARYQDFRRSPSELSICSGALPAFFAGSLAAKGITLGAASPSATAAP
jgi:hypothetical protein